MRLKPEEIQVGDVFEAGDRLQYHWMVVSLKGQHVRLKSTTHFYLEDITVLRSAICRHSCIQRGLDVLPYSYRS
jgi:hypothetical protein